MAGVNGLLVWSSPISHLPAYLLQLREKQYGIFVINKNKAKFIPLSSAEEGRPIAINNEERWKNWRLVVNGRHGLIDGQLVKVIDKNKLLQQEAK